MIIQDHDGAIQIESLGAQADVYCACSHADMVADPAQLWDCVAPDDRPRLLVAAMKAAAGLTPLDVEFRIAWIHGDTPSSNPGNAARAGETAEASRWIHLRAHPFPERDGRVRWVGIASDATERQGVFERLRQNELMFTNTARNIPGAVCRYGVRADGTDYVEYMSAGCLELWELPVEEVLRDAAPLWGMVHEQYLEPMQAAVAHSAQTLEAWYSRWQITTPSGQMKWLEGAGQPQRTPDGGTLWDSVILDVTPRVLAEQERQRSQALYRLLADNTSDLVLILNRDGVCQYASPSSRKLLDVAAEELIGVSLFDHIGAQDAARLARFISEVTGPESVIYRARGADGGEMFLEGRAQAVPNVSGDGIERVLMTSRDVTQRVRMESRLRHEATHDLLTGLPNRTLLEERLTRAIERQKHNPQSRFAVFFLDLDRFKFVNDSLGHQVGDQLLIHVSRQLSSLIKPTDLAARLSGDEFVVLLENVAGLDEVIAQVQRVDQCLRSPVQLSGRAIHTTASVGIVMSAAHYETATELLRDVDIAMYRSKADPTAQYTVFDPAMHESMLERLHLESDLRRAVRADELDVYYQPIVELETGRTIGAEALGRWWHPERSQVSPQRFISIAEESGLIVELDERVLARALADFSVWRRRFADQAPRYVSVNLSALDLKLPELPNRICNALRRAGLQPHHLQLEITESMLIGSLDEVESRLRALVDAGVRVSLDDFGTGFSSLAYLHRLPVQSLKADRSFVAAAREDAVAQSILKSLGALSESLGLQLIAEGVEYENQIEMLRRLGYRFAQGYHFGKPMAVTAFHDHLAKAAPAAAAEEVRVAHSQVTSGRTPSGYRLC